MPLLEIDPPGLLELGASVLTVERTGGAGGPLAITAEQASPDDRDRLPWHDVLSLGPDGIGGSLRPLPSQIHDADNVDTEQWDVARMGDATTKMGLGLAAPPTVFAVASPSDPTVTTLATPTGATNGAGNVWANPGNIAASDDARATVALNGDSSANLDADAWGAALSGTVVGVEVQVECHYTGGGVAPTLSVQLLDAGGAVTGTARTANVPASTDAYVTLGGPTDTWGAAPTAAMLNDADAGVRIVATGGVGGTVGYSSKQAGGAGVSDNSTGVVTWITPTAVPGPQNGTYTNAGPMNAGQTEFLNLSTFGFAVSGTVTGIALTLHNVWATGGGTGFFYAKLLVNGAEVGSWQLIGQGQAYSQTLTFGGASELWGAAAPTAAEVNGATFGVRIYGYCGGGTVTFYIDAATLVVYTTSPTAQTVAVDHVRLRVYTDDGAKFLYVGAGNVLKKVRCATGTGVPAVTVEETKTFTHGTGAPSISDICVAKSGAAPGDARILIGFANQAQLEQINTIAASGADTYQAKHANVAYAGKFAKVQGSEATEVRIWKTTQAGALSGSTGPMTRLQNVALSASALDLTNYSNWEPATPYPVGGWEHDINALIEFGPGVLVARPDGAWQFNTDGHGFLFMPFRSFVHQDNGKGMIGWGASVLIPTVQDLLAAPAKRSPAVGISTLLSNRGRIQGYPTATAWHGGYIYVAYYDGTDSYILRCKPATERNRVPQELVFYPVTTVADVKVEALSIFADAQGTSWFVFPCASDTPGLYDVAYQILGPQAMRRYALEGFLETATFGSMRKTTYVERLLTYAQGVVAGAVTVTPAIAWDGGSYVDVDTIETAGRSVLTLTSGVNDSGNIGRVKLTFSSTTPSARPELYGVPDREDGPGGIYLEGWQTADAVRVMQITARVSEAQIGAGGLLTLGGDLQTRAEGVLDRAATTTTVRCPEYFGDTATRTCRVVSVQELQAEKDSPLRAGERRYRITLRLPQEVA